MTCFEKFCASADVPERNTIEIRMSPIVNGNPENFDDATDIKASINITNSIRSLSLQILEVGKDYVRAYTANKSIKPGVYDVVLFYNKPEILVHGDNERQLRYACAVNVYRYPWQKKNRNERCDDIDISPVILEGSFDVGGVGVASDALPLMDGEANAGTALEYSRGDHVHPSDSAKANVTDIPTKVSQLKNDSAYITAVALADYVPMETYNALEDRVAALESKFPPPITDLIFNKSISDPANITGAGERAIVDILPKVRRCLTKKTAEGEVTIAYLDNESSLLYEDGSEAILTGDEGDVMVYKPEFYYRHRLVSDSEFAYEIAEKAVGDGWIHSPASLIGAYKAQVVSSKLYSRSGVAPTDNVSQANFIAYAKSRGAGYNIIDFEQHCMIALLFFAKYGTRNSQGILGVGSASYSPATATGTTNSLGNRDTENSSTGYVNFLGIEGVHGGYYEWVAGAEINAHVWTVTDPDGTQRTGATGASDLGYILETAAAQGPYFDLIPTELGGSNLTYYCDFYLVNAYSGRALARSGSDVGELGGVSFTEVSIASSAASLSFASRLAFRGVIREAESISAFKALPVL